MSKLTRVGTRPTRAPVQARCARGCGAYADHGFPGDLWFIRAHIPAALLAPRPAAPMPAAATLGDLFSSAPADASRRPT
jgi:hypothetical protein